jgi:hypothetical protein
LIRKQWLFLSPVGLAVINTLAFFAVYASTGDPLSVTDFFRASFDRWRYIDDHFVSTFSWTPQLAIAIVAGLAACLLAAMIRPPFFRAIAGSGYPLAPRRWRDVSGLFLLYIFMSLIFRLLPMPVPAEGPLAQLTVVVHLVIGILIIFADYVIVYEELGFIAGLRRSMQLCASRWVTVVLLFAGIQVLWFGFDSLYRLFYEQGGRVLILLPISQILVESLVVLFVDLILIYLYEEIRRRSPAG